jgi:small ligand-binding sensory domain FIST
VGEAAGQVLEELGPNPDLVTLFVTPHHAGALEDAAAAVRAVLSPTALIGCAAVSVVGVRHEAEDEPGVALWAGRFGPVRGFRDALPADVPFVPQAVVLLADPFSFDVDGFYEAVESRWPGLPVVGGNASAARGPGGNRLVLDDVMGVDGAVGALIGPGARVDVVVSQGCRPVGNPYVVTKAERNVVYELAGRPALERLVSMVQGGAMSDEDVALINTGLHLGTVVDEHKAVFERGDFLVHNVIGADRSVGAIAVGDEVAVGSTVQFHVRDAASADEDLHEALDGRGDADGALLFTCNGRGRRLFGTPHHDADVFDDEVGGPVAGFFAAGEFGPVGRRNFVHGFTASVALFHDA